jgi:hypothetical protein
VSYNPLGLSIGASKTESVTESIVRATITGNPYWADTGIVVYRRNSDADSFIGLQNHWLTDAYASLTTTVDENTAECGTASRFTANLNGHAFRAKPKSFSWSGFRDPGAVLVGS